jgi:sugar phosphate isomerase/epimerase
MPEYTPEGALQLLHELGYDGVEWRVADQAAPADERPSFWGNNRCTLPLSTLESDGPRIGRLAREAGLEMPAIGTYAESRDATGVEQAMRGVVAMGARQLRVNAPRYDGSEEYHKLLDRALGEYREVEALARKYDLRALVEIHPGRLTSSATSAAHFAAHFDPKYVGVIHDAGNMVYEGYEQYKLGMEALGPYLAHVHIKNAVWEKVGTRQDGSAVWKPDAAPLCEGIVDLAALFSALLSVGYDGWLSVEDFSTRQPTRERLSDDLRYVRQIVEAVAGSISGPS